MGRGKVPATRQLAAPVYPMKGLPGVLDQREVFLAALDLGPLANRTA
jgi:hypothetical protein